MDWRTRWCYKIVTAEMDQTTV